MEWKENLSTETVSRFVELISIIYLRVFLFRSIFFHSIRTAILSLKIDFVIEYGARMLNDSVV